MTTEVTRKLTCNLCGVAEYTYTEGAVVECGWCHAPLATGRERTLEQWLVEGYQDPRTAQEWASWQRDLTAFWVYQETGIQVEPGGGFVASLLKGEMM